MPLAGTGGEKSKYWGKIGVITDESISISQLLWRHGPRLPPRSMPMPGVILPPS